MIDFNKFVKDLDGPLLAGGRSNLFEYKRGNLLFPEKMRFVRFKFGNYFMQIATGWSPEIGDCSQPPRAQLPFKEYESLYCVIRPDDDGEKLVRILQASPVWKKFKKERISWSGRITMIDFYEIYRLIQKTEKLTVML